MAIYRVWSGGDNTGGANNTNWSQAYTTLSGALAVPPTSGDFVLVHYTSQESVGAAATWTIPAGVYVVAVNKDASEAPTPMGESGWVGASAGAFVMTLVLGSNTHVFGITVRNGGTSATNINVWSQTAGHQASTESCMVWLGSTSSSSRIVLGQTGADRSVYNEHRNLTVRFSATTQGINVNGDVVWNGGAVSSNGASPATLFRDLSTNDPGGLTVEVSGVDLSHVSGTLLSGGITTAALRVYMSQCKLDAAVTPLGSVTNASKAGPRIWIVDCSDDAGTPARGIWGYYDGLGSVVKETGIYRTDGAAGWSWKVIGTSNAKFSTPFVTPWIEYENTVNTSITPRFEIFRDGSTTAYTDAQVWAEWALKATSGSDQAAFNFGDRQALSALVAGTAASNQAAGSGFGDWATGTSADWSGKVDSGSAITAAEDGILRGRVAVVGAITVYVDPQIRT